MNRVKLRKKGTILLAVVIERDLPVANDTVHLVNCIRRTSSTHDDMVPSFPVIEHGHEAMVSLVT